MTSRNPQVTTPRMTCVIAAKGGIGQSTVCLDWARALGRSGKRCLLIELAGGDIAWLIGAAPQHFAEDVARGTTALDSATVQVEDNVELLATGNEWSIYGPADVGTVEALFASLDLSRWDDILIDLGDVSRPVAQCVLGRSQRRAVLLHNDVACVARTYTLLRMLGATDLAHATSLVFNRIDNGTDADSLLERFSQLTTRFLNRTWPLLGTVPDASSDERVRAIDAWEAAGVPIPEAASPASNQERIINRPVLADN